MKKFYITTSIAYVNAEPHIGYAQELLVADVLARWHRSQGDQVFFLTGTDEHGVKVWETAKKEGIEVAKLVDQNALKYLELTKLLNISNDDFIRTTEDRHLKLVHSFWRKLKATGDIYKKHYRGLYCPGCESFKTKKELVNGCCPWHNLKPQELEEENYFFALSKYSAKLKDFFKQNPDFVIPEFRYNEIKSLANEGLEDISISRAKEKLPWGIEVPDDPTQVIYVWFEALLNYLHPIKFWPADLHVIGKDILRFHAALWPAILMSTGYPLPKKIYVHGFISVDGRRMSKTLGNVIAPEALVDQFGVDGSRYLLLRELNPLRDSGFSFSKAQTRHDADLANDLGNLVQRVLTLSSKAKIIYQPKKLNQDKLIKKITHLIDNLDLTQALEETWKEIANLNQLVDRTKPWELISNNPAQAKRIINKLLVSIATIATILKPFIPIKAQEIEDQLLSGKKKILFPKKS